MTGHFSVKNFEAFQHYKDRTPPWIKLYNALLDDYEFGLLPDASKAHLLAIWLLASRYSNLIPYDTEWISRRINATEKINLKLLSEKGFIVLDQGCSNMLANGKHSAIPEREREGETERDNIRAKKQKGYSPEFEKFWQAWPGRGDASDPKKPAGMIFERHVKNGADPEDMIAGARTLAAKQKASGAEPRFNPMAQTWINQERWQDETPRSSEGEMTRAERQQMIEKNRERLRAQGIQI